MIARRRLVLAAGMGLLSAALAPRARAQSSKPARVGVLWHAGSIEEEGKYHVALRQGFRDLGYVEGKNIVFEERFPNEDSEKFRSQAFELASLDLNVLVGITLPAALALQHTGTKIPIVFVLVPDPVAAKLVPSLAQPGGSITGFSNVASDLNAKRLQLFKEAVGGISRVALLVNPRDVSTTRTIEDLKSAGDKLNIAVHPVEVRGFSDFDSAFSTIARSDTHGVVTAIDPLFYAGRKQLAELAIAHRLPTAHSNGDAVEAGFLMSYGTNHEAIFRRAPTYVDKILKGARPANLPVEQPTEFGISVNLNTAKALGITIPQSVLLRATRVVG